MPVNIYFRPYILHAGFILSHAFVCVIDLLIGSFILVIIQTIIGIGNITRYRWVYYLINCR